MNLDNMHVPHILSVLLFTLLLIQNTINTKASSYEMKENPFGPHASTGNSLENLSDQSLIGNNSGRTISTSDNNSILLSAPPQHSISSKIVKPRDNVRSNLSNLNESSLNIGNNNKLGSVYVVDYANIRVQKFDLGGHFITKWGTEGTGNGQLKRPAGIAIDSGDNIYVSDAGNDRIEKFDNSGKFLLKWGSQGNGNGQLDSPHDIAIDDNGNLYVVEQGNFRVQVFSSDGKFITKWGSAGSNENQFLDPHSIIVSHHII